MGNFQSRRRISPEVCAGCLAQKDIEDIEFLLRTEGKALSDAQLRRLNVPRICERVEPLLLSDSTLIRVEGPIIVVGDLHGMLHGLQRIFSRFGAPPMTKFIFLGDYVDRGPAGIECLLLLLLLKLRHPQHIFLLRGNHESEKLNISYGFAAECRKRLGRGQWEYFLSVFNALPLAAVISKRVFCVHGGISPQLSSIRAIEEISRPLGVPDSGMVHDLLWTDPSPDDESHWSGSTRGASYFYGRAPVEAFLELNGLSLICRSHSFVPKGYTWRFGGKLVTIFSAVDYCGTSVHNEPAILQIDEDGTCTPINYLKHCRE